MRMLHSQRGFSLFEVLIAISVFALVGTIAAELIGISFQAERTSAQRTIARQLAQETTESVSAIALERWDNIYALSKGSANHYHTVVSGGSWATSSSDQLLTVNGAQYRRYFFVENVSRDTGGAITESGGNDDPSTQKITAVVSWENSEGLTLGTATTTEYITRSRNSVATQTNWVSAGQSANPTSGENADFNSDFAAKDSTISVSNPSGSLTLTQQ